MQRRVLWLSGMAELMLDEHEKNKNFSLEELFPDVCLPVDENDSVVDCDDVDILD